MIKKSIALILLVSLTLCGCSAKNIQAYAKEKKKFKDVNAVTKEEMVEYALEVLEYRYGCEFEMEDEGLYYTDKNEDKVAIRSRLSGHAHRKGHPEDSCGIMVEEPNLFKENYYGYKYKNDIEEILNKDVEKSGLSGGDGFSSEAHIGFMIKEIPEEGTPKELLKSDITEATYVLYLDRDFIEKDADKETSEKEYVFLIRRWLDYLFALDHEWYFEIWDSQYKDPDLHDLEHIDACYFAFQKGDRNIRSSDNILDSDLVYDIEGRK